MKTTINILKRLLIIILIPIFLIILGIPIFWILSLPYWILTGKNMLNDIVKFLENLHK